jgi:hypothetical protein
MALARYSDPVRWLLLAVAVASFPAAGALAAEPQAVKEAEAAAREVMEAFLRAFNAQDEAAWADTLLFPHVRLASGNVLVYPDRAAFLGAMDLARFADETGWDHSTWDDLQVIQASPQKVHIAVTFSRYDQQGSVMESFHSLYVIENVDGRWGVRARSSFAP